MDEPLPTFGALLKAAMIRRFPGALTATERRLGLAHDIANELCGLRVVSTDMVGEWERDARRPKPIYMPHLRRALVADDEEWRALEDAYQRRLPLVADPADERWTLTASLKAKIVERDNTIAALRREIEALRAPPVDRPMTLADEPGGGHDRG